MLNYNPGLETEQKYRIGERETDTRQPNTRMWSKSLPYANKKVEGAKC